MASSSGSIEQTTRERHSGSASRVKLSNARLLHDSGPADGDERMIVMGYQYLMNALETAQVWLADGKKIKNIKQKTLTMPKTVQSPFKKTGWVFI